MAAEVPDRLDLDSVVQDRLDEGVLTEVAGGLDGDGPTTHDVAELTGMLVTSPVGAEIADDDQLGPRRVATTGSRHHRRQRVRGVSGEILPRTRGTRLSTSAIGFRLDPVDDGNAHFGRQGTRKSDHPLAIQEVTKLS